MTAVWCDVYVYIQSICLFVCFFSAILTSFYLMCAFLDSVCNFDISLFSGNMSQSVCGLSLLTWRDWRCVAVSMWTSCVRAVQCGIIMKLRTRVTLTSPMSASTLSRPLKHFSSLSDGCMSRWALCSGHCTSLSNCALTSNTRVIR